MAKRPKPDIYKRVKLRFPEFPLHLRATITSESLEKGKLYALLSDQKLKDEMQEAVHRTKAYAEKYLKAYVRVDEILVLPGSIQVATVFHISLQNINDRADFVRYFHENLGKISRAFEAMLYATNTKIPNPSSISATAHGAIPENFAKPKDPLEGTPYIALAVLLVAGFAYLMWSLGQAGGVRLSFGRHGESGRIGNPAREYRSLSGQESECLTYEAILLDDGTEILIPAECSRYR